jgi:hypothetical protein
LLLLIIQRRRLVRIWRVDASQGSEPAQEATREIWIVRWSQRHRWRAYVNHGSWRLVDDPPAQGSHRLAAGLLGRRGLRGVLEGKACQKIKRVAVAGPI